MLPPSLMSVGLRVTIREPPGGHVFQSSPNDPGLDTKVLGAHLLHARAMSCYSFAYPVKRKLYRIMWPTPDVGQ